MERLQEDLRYNELYHQLADIGCVLDLAVFDLPTNPAVTDAELHHQAAIALLQTLENRYATNPVDVLTLPENLLQKLTKPSPISRAEFLGGHCDLEKRSLLLPGTRKNNWYLRFWFGDAEDEKNHVALPRSQFGHGGLSGLFLDPPYGLIGTKDSKNHLFFKLIDDVLCSCPADMSIFAWSTDTSEYFDPGKEWWGSYFWTVYSKTAQRLVAITASATD